MEVVDNDRPTSKIETSPKAFNEEYERFLGGKSTPSGPSLTSVNVDDNEDVQILSDGDDSDNDISESHRKTTLTPTKECSVKLVDINDLVDNGEPLAKRPRPADPLALGRKTETNNVFPSKLSENKKEHVVKTAKDQVPIL